MATTTPLLHSALASDRPLFSRQRVSHQPPHPVTHLATSNLQVILVLANKTVHRFNQSKKAGDGSASIEVIDFSKLCAGNARVNGAYLDPLGAHLLLSLRPSDPEGLPDVIYLGKKSQRFRSSGKIKGNLITSVSWCAKNTAEVSSGPVLMATSKGVVYESELESKEDRMFSSSFDKYFKVLIDLGKGQHMPITGLSYFNVEGTKKYFVLVTTASRLYQFLGNISSSEDARPLLVNVFDSDATQLSKFLELPGSLRSPLSLALGYVTKERGRAFAKTPLYPASFGWLTGSGIYYGRVDASFGEDTVTADCQLLQFPATSSREGDDTMAPKGIILTEFHAILAYDHSVRGICLLNQQVVYTADFDPAEGAVRGIAKDPISGNFFIYTDYFIHKFKVDQEDRNVWKIYLEAGDFELAQQCCRGDPDKLNEVLTQRAQNLFEGGQFVESAMHFAKTRCSFEEIALKFIQVEEKEALLNYLKKKLETVRPSEKTQLTLIVVWLVEIYLSRIRRLEEGGEGDRERAEAAKREFGNMLQTSKIDTCVAESKGAIYDLLASHGDNDTIVRFASFVGDFDRVVRRHLQSRDHHAALAVLKEQRRAELYYQHGPELMKALPERYISAVIEQGVGMLSPTKILPSLVVSCTREQEMQSIRYLEFVINAARKKEPALHNFLISLYVKHQPDKIEDYLHSQGTSARETPYDIEYTLRLLTENELKRESIFLYCLLGQLEEAVKIALEVDPTLAEGCLEFATDSETKRMIWLKIAQHVVQKENDIRRAMNYLKKSGDLVKIEDILPFFPDFVTIDHFKEAICDSLQEYSDHIEMLRLEMEESNHSADAIREEIQQYKNGHVFVRTVDTCSVCSGFLMSDAFHVFGCGHRLHTTCLVDLVKPYLSSARRRRLEDLQAQLVATTASRKTANTKADLDSMSNEKSPRLSKKELIRSEIDEIVAHECFFCGDIMIKMIDKPLVDPENYETRLTEWK